MVTLLPLSENSLFRKIVIFLTLLLCEINFVWIVKEQVTEIFENILLCNFQTYFSDPERKTLLLKGENSPFRKVVILLKLPYKYIF